MPIREIGAFLLILVIVFLFGNLWFHFIESMLRRIKKLFTRHKKPPAWHPLPRIGAFLLILVIVFLFGNLWFHFIESMLRRIKKLFTRHKKPPAWHPLPREKED